MAIVCCLFFTDLDGAYYSIILNGNKREVEFALGRGRNIMENPNNGPVSNAAGYFENIEVFHQGLAIAIHIKYSATDAAQRIRGGELGFCKVQSDRIFAAFHHGN